MQPFCYCSYPHPFSLITELPAHPPTPPATNPTFPSPTGADIQVHNDTAYTIVLILFSSKCKDVYIGRTQVCSWVVTLPNTIMGASFFKKKQHHKEIRKGLSIELFRIDTFKSVKEKITQIPTGYLLSNYFPPEAPQQQPGGADSQANPSTILLPNNRSHSYQTHPLWNPYPLGKD